MLLSPWIANAVPTSLGTIHGTVLRCGESATQGPESVFMACSGKRVRRRRGWGHEWKGRGKGRFRLLNELLVFAMLSFEK